MRPKVRFLFETGKDLEKIFFAKRRKIIDVVTRFSYHRLQLQLLQFFSDPPEASQLVSDCKYLNIYNNI